MYKLLFIAVLLTGCEKMSIRQFNAQNKTTTSTTIGGTPLYIIAGQSNCGRARVSEMTGGESAVYAPAVTNAYMLNRYRYAFNGVVNFEAFDAGTNTMLQNALYTDEFGPEASLAYELQNYQSKARYYIKLGAGNTDLPTWWLPPSSVAWTQLLQIIEEGLNDAGLPGNIKLHAFIWMQGENDATDLTWSNNYLSNLTSFFDGFRDYWVNDNGRNSDYKIVIGRIQDINAGYEEIVRAAQDSFCGNGANNAILINTDAYTRKDYIHYDATSQIQFGIDIFNQVKDL